MCNFIKLIEEQVSHTNGMVFIEQQIRLLFNAISKTENLEDAELLFKNLEDIQLILARAVFGDEVTVTDFLANFIYDYDRTDDIMHKKHLYQQIKCTNQDLNLSYIN